MYRTDDSRTDKAAILREVEKDVQFRRAVNEEARRQVEEKKRKERTDGADYIKNLEKELKEKEAHLYESEVM